MTEAEKTFTCEVCNMTFGYAWTDEDANVETVEKFGSHPDTWREPGAVICDDCYKQMLAKEDAYRQLMLKRLAKLDPALVAFIEKVVVADIVRQVLGRDPTPEELAKLAKKDG